MTIVDPVVGGDAADAPRGRDSATGGNGGAVRATLSAASDHAGAAVERVRTTRAALASRLPAGWPGAKSGDEDEEISVDPDRLAAFASAASGRADRLADLVEERTVDVDESVDEDAFFSTPGGGTTVANRYDLEKAVPVWQKDHFREVDRYWVNEPYAFVVIFHARRENETKYYLVEPYLNPVEADLRDFLAEKLRSTLDYGEERFQTRSSDADRSAVIEREARRLLRRYGLYSDDASGGRGTFSLDSLVPGSLAGRLGNGSGDVEANGRAVGSWRSETTGTEVDELDGVSARPEPAVLAESNPSLTDYQVRKLLYYLERDFVGYGRIDGVTHDVNVEDVSCDGYDSPVFVYHSQYENLITNVGHGRDELDDFVIKLAQRGGKAISKRQPQVDVTLPDGSRAQLTLGREVSDHGTNYTIRQFRDVPFTPVDLVNWRTFSIDQMAYLWLAIESGKSMLFAGGTASGKTTSLNAVSLFIPGNAKVISIEDTREVELPHRNWVASVTRPTFSADDRGDVDEFDLLEAALRQRPDYIVMGEVRGEEGRTLFQIMSTGHTTYTTFHAGTVGEVLKRFTTEPINVSKTLFTALDLVSVQTQTRLSGRKVRRARSITEIDEYNPSTDEIYATEVFEWRAETDEFDRVGQSGVMEEIAFDRGWSHDELADEIEKRRVVLAYLVRNGLNEYAQVAATIQAFIADPETTMALVADGTLAERLGNLRRLESVDVDVDPAEEALAPRPEPDEETLDRADAILAQAEGDLLERYRNGEARTALLDALGGDAPGSSLATRRARTDGSGTADGEASPDPNEPTAGDD